MSVEIPKRRLTVFTGVSGSGNSSLVFDTIGAESRRLIHKTNSACLQVNRSWAAPSQLYGQI